MCFPADLIINPKWEKIECGAMDKLRKDGDQGSVDHEQPVISSYIMIHLVSKSCTVWI